MAYEHNKVEYGVALNIQSWQGSACQATGTDDVMDEITIKTTNPKSHLYWCLIEFIDWRYSRHVGIFDRFVENIAPLTFSLVHHPPPIPFPV